MFFKKKLLSLMSVTRKHPDMKDLHVANSAYITNTGLAHVEGPFVPRVEHNSRTWQKKGTPVQTRMQVFQQA